MTERTPTPISDANANALDAMRDALNSDAPDRIDQIWQAYYAGYNALANALQANQGTLAELLNKRFDRIEAGQARKEGRLDHIDENVGMMLKQLHQVATFAQGHEAMILDQALATSLLDERLTTVEKVQTTIKSDLAAIKKHLGL